MPFDKDENFIGRGDILRRVDRIEHAPQIHTDFALKHSAEAKEGQYDAQLLRYT
jgi:hypothetical protein